MDEEEVLRYGLIYSGFDNTRQKGVKRRTNVKRFISCYGVAPKAVAALIKDLPLKEIEPKKLFLTLNYMKTYETETVLSGWWNESKTTVRNSIKTYLQAIQSLKEKKVSLLDISSAPSFSFP